MPIEVRGLTSVDLSKSIGEQVRQFTIHTFEQVLAAEVRAGFDSQPILITDGRLRKDYMAVRPFGRIEARARAQMADVIDWLLAELQRRSPVLTHRYQNSHMVVVGDRIVTDWKTLPVGQPVMICNIQPYAGKIEGKDAWTRWEGRGGKRGTRRAKRRAQGWKPRQMRGQSSQAPNGVYRVVVQELNRRYGRTVAAVFRPQELPATVTSGKVMMRRKGGGKMRAQIYPTVVLNVMQ